MVQTVHSTTDNVLAADSIVPAAISLIRQHSDHQYRVPRLSVDARMRLAKHKWRGGRTELDTCIQRAMVLCDGDVIDADDLQFTQDNAQRAQSVMLHALRTANGVRSEAARRLGINTSTLRRQLAGMRAQGLNVPQTAPVVTELHHE